MDKNKNRTNMLAAGRKRLQQFRQNKDSKGSKSMGKAGKSEHDSDADVVSAAAKPTTELVRVPDEEVRSGHESDARIVDSTVACSGDKTDIDIATNDPFSVPESSTVTTIFASNVELLPEDPGVNEGAYQSESTFTVNAESARPTSSGIPESLVSEMDSAHFAVPMRVDSCTPSDLVGAIEPVAVEAVSGHGADQVPDGADCLASKQVDRSGAIAFEGDARCGLRCLIESDGTFAGTVSGDTGMEKPAIEIDQPNLNVVSASAGVTNKVNEVWTMDGHLVSAHPLLESHGSSAVLPEVAVHQREDVVATSSNEKKSEIPSTEWVETDMKREVHGKEKLMESKMVSLSSDVGVISVSLSQLMEVLRRLDKEAFRLLVTSSESAATADFSTASSITNAELRSSSQLLAPDYQADDVLQRLKEQLYLTNLAKDVFLLQLDEQMELQMEFDHQRQQLLDEVSNASTLVSEVQGRNESLAEELAKYNSELQAAVCAKEELEKQFVTAKAEIMEISIRADELHVELDRSHGELSSLSVELAECKALLSDLHVENDNLNGNLSLLSEEKKNLAEEKGHLVIENEKVLTELAECRGLLQSLQIENVDLSGRLALITEERMKLEELQGSFVHENEKLVTELSECKALLEGLRVENANLNGGLTLVLEEKNRIVEEKDHVVAENERLSMELADCRSIVAGLQMEHHKAVDGLKEATLRLGQLTEENIKLSSRSGEFVNQTKGSDVPSRGQEQETDADETHPIPSGGETELFFPPLIGPNDGLVDGSTIEQLKLDVRDQCFVFLKRRLEEAERMILKLENAIEGMHLHSVSLSMSSGKMVAPGVSRLIQAFESKGQHDEQDTEEVASTENQLPGDPYRLTMEQAGNLRAVLKDLVQNAENVSEIFKSERHCRIFADAALGELKVTYEALKEHNSSSEAANIELAVLYEFMKQHVFDTEAKKSKLLALYEVVRQQSIILEAENSELVKKLGNFQSHISELERQLDGMRSGSDEIASSISNDVEVLHKEIAERASILEQQWNSTVALVVETVGKLDTLIGSSFSSTLSTDNSDGQDIGSCVAASVDAATKVIEDLQVKLKASREDQDEIQSSYKDMIEKFNGLHEKNELAVSVLHRIYGNLGKLVNDSCGYVEQSQIIIQNENLLDPMHLDICDTLIEQLAVLLGERLQLESVNNELNSELIGKTKDMEELRKRSVDSDAILKLVEDIEDAVKLESTGIEDKLESRLQYLTSFLLQKYKEADEQVRLSRETKFSKDLELNELQGQINHLRSLIVQHENEILVLKESLRQGAEDLASVRNELQDKVNELEQSEQRASSIREKLSIAVSKGKGLIVQRDNLKQSLAETSNELEKCLHELHLKDARLREVETNLKTYSEAGERVEALESELSYIRNSATALRESFLLKDSVIQRIEEILEDLELPEQFHSRDIIEKVDWLARSVAGNSLPLTDWDQKSSVVGGSYSDAGFVEMDAWKDETQQNSNSGDDLRRNYEELQNRFYGLAEQNEMLEQSLIKRNNVVQRWEEILERINMPLQLRSREPEDRIEWLGSALSEAHHHCSSLQQKVDNLETYCAALSADLEESQKSLSDLEPALQAVTCEKERLSDSLEFLTHNYGKVSEKVVQFEVENDKLQNEVTALQDKVVQLELENDKLQNEVTALQERLVEKVGNQEHIESEIRRLADFVGAVLQDSVTEDVVSGCTSTECLERLLQKLVTKCTTLSVQKHILVDSVDQQNAEKVGFVQDETRVSEDLKEDDVAVLRKELEEALRDLLCVKEERDRYMENAQSLVRDVEALDVKRQELQGLLSQEEQRSASLREKLNVAVRKGKSLVQQRDNLKQTVEEVNNEVECLRSEINNRESSISDYEQKIKDLSTYQERVVVLESESLLLKNQLAETEYSSQEKTHTLSLILNTLNDIGVDFDINTSNPVAKLEQIGNQCQDLHAAVASSEHDSRKSKRATELLLAELNEVQERNDGLQEELAKAASELSELSRERDLAEAAKREAFSQVEKLSSNLSEERHNQFAELMVLKSCVVQLRKGFFDINDLLGNVLSKDLEYLHNLEASMMSCLEPSEVQNVFSQPLGRAGYIISSNEENKEKFMATNSLLDSKIQELVDDNSFAEICSLVGHQLQDLMKEIGALREELYQHLIILDEGTKHLSERLSIFHREATSQKQSFKSMEENIVRLEAIEKEKDTEIVVMRRNISLLYEACSSSVVEIENLKAQFVGSGFAATDIGMNLEPSVSTDSGNLFSRQTILSSEECIRTMADRLLSVVKDFTSVHAKIVEGGQKEMKTTISNLQKELQEKDIQKDRICMELVNQIKEAEATARGHLQDLQSVKARLHDLERQLEVEEEERNELEERVKELQNSEATLKDLEERVLSLNNSLAAKEQEIEALTQALGEEETQMEDLTNKIGELETVVQQKNLDLESLEASRGKAMKKLSITVNKFDELHHLSASLLSEVEKLQLQLQERDVEISFLRQEVTRCTNDALVASQMSNKGNSDEIHDLLAWLDTMISGVQVHDVHFDDKNADQVHECKEIIQKQIVSLISELEDMRAVIQSRDMLLQVERSRVEELARKGEYLENSLREKESQLTRLQGVGDSGQTGSMASEIMEVEPVISKRAIPGTSITPQVRSLRKVNNDQVAIAIDVDPGSGGRLEDEDDDKAHGFKSLTTSRIVPRFTRPVTDMIDGLWVTCDRTLMRQPALRLVLIVYWGVLHALLATFVV